jgi:hypothetical protein
MVKILVPPFLYSNNNMIYAHVQYKKGATDVNRRLEKNSERKKPKLLDIGTSAASASLVLTINKRKIVIK